MLAKPSSPLIRFWYTKAGPGIPLEYLERLPEKQKEHFKSIRSNKRKKQYLYSRMLICEALSQHFNKHTEYWDIEERENSAPAIHNLPKPTFFSLSHSHNLICFAFSDFEIGIDVERIVPRNFDDTSTLFMNKSEQKRMYLKAPGSNKEQYFYRLWCAKEALYKALPISTQKQHTLASLVYDDLIHKRSKYHLYETVINNYRVALVSTKPITSKEITFSKKEF